MKLIQLTQGKFAQVDDEDFERASKYTWSAAKRVGGHFYAVSGSNYYGGKQMNLHRFIMNIDPDDKTYVDHIDRDGLNCQKHNLRTCTNQQNQYNSIKNVKKSSIYKGVYLLSRVTCIRYGACIRINKLKTHLGTFENELDAAKAYDEAAKKNFGEFALINNV